MLIWGGVKHEAKFYVLQRIALEDFPLFRYIVVGYRANRFLLYVRTTLRARYCTCLFLMHSASSFNDLVYSRTFPALYNLCQSHCLFICASLTLLGRLSSSFTYLIVFQLSNISIVLWRRWGKFFNISYSFLSFLVFYSIVEILDINHWISLAVIFLF